MVTADENRESFALLIALDKFFRLDGVIMSPYMRDYYAKKAAMERAAAVKRLGRTLFFSAELALKGVLDFFEKAATICEGKEVVTEVAEPVLFNAHTKKNTFIRSLERQFNEKGALSARQLSALKGSVAMTPSASLVLDPLFAKTEVGANGDFFESLRDFYTKKGRLSFKQARAISRYF